MIRQWNRSAVKSKWISPEDVPAAWPSAWKPEPGWWALRGTFLLGFGPKPTSLPSPRRCDANLAQANATAPTTLRNHATRGRQKGEAHPHRTSTTTSCGGGEKGSREKEPATAAAVASLHTGPPPNQPCRRRRPTWPNAGGLDQKCRRRPAPSAKMRPRGAVPAAQQNAPEIAARGRSSGYSIHRKMAARPQVERVRMRVYDLVGGTTRPQAGVPKRIQGRGLDEGGRRKRRRWRWWFNGGRIINRRQLEKATRNGRGERGGVGWPRLSLGPWPTVRCLCLRSRVASVRSGTRRRTCGTVLHRPAPHTRTRTAQPSEPLSYPFPACQVNLDATVCVSTLCGVECAMQPNGMKKGSLCTSAQRHSGPAQCTMRNSAMLAS